MAKKVSAVQQESFNGVLSQLAIVRGVVSVLFGIFALVWPGLTLVTFGILLSIWLLVSGVTGIISSIFVRHRANHWFLKLLASILQLGVGAYLVQRPGVSVATVIALIAIVLIADGVIDLVVSFIEKSSMTEKILPIIGGILGVIAGLVVWQYPVGGSLAFVWVLGLFALVGGSLSIAMGVDLSHADD